MLRTAKLLYGLESYFISKLTTRENSVSLPVVSSGVATLNSSEELSVSKKYEENQCSVTHGYLRNGVLPFLESLLEGEYWHQTNSQTTNGSILIFIISRLEYLSVWIIIILLKQIAKTRSWHDWAPRPGLAWPNWFSAGCRGEERRASLALLMSDSTESVSGPGRPL